MEIILIRHTSVAVGRGICYGRSDVDVADTFESEAKRVLEKLPENIDEYEVISSPLKRCYLLAEKIKSEIQTDDRIVELSFGDWEMKQWDDVPREAINNWSSNLSQFKSPDGESFEELKHRIIPAFEGYFSEPGNKIIVAHGGVIRTIVSHLLGTPIDNIFKIRIDYGGVSKIEITNGLPLVTCINR